MEQLTPQTETETEQLSKKLSGKRIPLWAESAVLAVVVILGALIILFGGKDPLPESTDPTDDTTAAAGINETVADPTSAVPVNPFAPDDFQYENGYLTCTTAESILGIDVSGYQKEIDWQQVKQAGVTFAIIRVGGRGWGAAGKLYADSYAQANYAGAKEAGIQVGTYFYSQAVSIEEAQEEANYVLELTKDWELDFPIVYDWEYVSAEARTANMDARTLTDCTLAFCQTITTAGHDAMIYFNPSQSSDLLYLDELLEYPFWLAMYQDTLAYPHRVDMWQYTRSGTVPGITGNVDINLYFPHDE